MIPRIGFLSVKPETFMERYGYGYANTLQTWSSDSTNPAPAPTIRIGRHDYLQAKVAKCDHCAHTSPLRDLRGGCVACGAPMKWHGDLTGSDHRATFTVESTPGTVIPKNEWGLHSVDGGDTVEVTAFGDTVRSFLNVAKFGVTIDEATSAIANLAEAMRA